MVACCTSDAALGGPFLAKTRYHIACGRRKTACSPVWDLFVRLQKPLLNDDYAARRSICAFSVVEGMWAVRADRVVLRWLDECDSQRRLCDPTEPLLLRGGVCRPPGRTSESRCSSNTAQTPTMLWRGHMLMILARLVRSESFWAIVKVRSPHTGPGIRYIIRCLAWVYALLCALCQYVTDRVTADGHFNPGPEIGCSSPSYYIFLLSPYYWRMISV